MIRRWWRTSVQFRLVSFPAAVVVVGGDRRARWRSCAPGRNCQASTLTRLEAAASLKGDELRRWLDGQRRDILVLAARPDLKRTAAAALGVQTTAASLPWSPTRRRAPKARTLFAAVLAQKPDLHDIFILPSIGGRIVCSSNPAHVGESRTLDAYCQKTGGAVRPDGISSPVTRRPLVSVVTRLPRRERVGAGVLGAHGISTRWIESRARRWVGQASQHIWSIATTC